MLSKKQISLKAWIKQKGWRTKSGKKSSGLQEKDIYFVKKAIKKLSNSVIQTYFKIKKKNYEKGVNSFLNNQNL